MDEVGLFVQKYSPRKLASGTFIYESRVISMSWTHGLRPFGHSTYVSVTSITSITNSKGTKNIGFDEVLIDAIINHVLLNRDKLKGSFVLLKGFNYNSFPFDCILVLAPSDSKLVGIPGIDKHRYDAIPVHHCELTGKEDEGVIKTILARFIKSRANWKRDIVPRLAWRLAKEGKNTRKFLLDSPSSLSAYLREHLNDGESVELQNWKEEITFISRKEDMLYMKDGSHEEHIPIQKGYIELTNDLVRAWVDRWCEKQRSS